MVSSSRSIRRLSTSLDLAFPALTIALGLQMLRVMIPSIVLHERAPSATPEFAAILLSTFLLAFVAPWLARLLGPRRALIVSAASVSLARVLLQVIRDVDARVWISSAGVLAFLWFVPIYLSYVRGSKRLLNFGLVFAAGIALDMTLHGLFKTYDYAWVIDLGTVALAVALTVAQLLLAAHFARTLEPALNGDVDFRIALPLAGIGPALFFEAILLQNLARHMATFGLPASTAFLLIALSNALGLLFGTLICTARMRSIWSGAFFLAAFWIGMSLVAVAVTDEIDTRFTIQGNVLLVLALVGMTTRLSESGGRPGIWRTASACALGMLSFAALLTVYYVAYDTTLPIENDVLFVVAALVVLAASLPGLVARAKGGPMAVGWTPAVLGAVLIVFPILARVDAREPRPPLSPGSFPVRVMSYNIRMGFNADGRMDLEALARTIESAGADVVALQEVSRGWYINGSADTLDWLSRRLDMSYVFAGAADPIWGNAVMSRYPLARSGSRQLPEAGVRPRRSLLWVEIELSDLDDLIVIATHLHHAGSGPRLAQLPVVLETYASWNGHARVVAGDMNSRPDSAEYARFRDAGLTDAYLLAGGDPRSGFTFRSDNPDVRIDYIWLSPELTATDLQIPNTTASDHLGIAVTVDR